MASADVHIIVTPKQYHLIIGALEALHDDVTDEAHDSLVTGKEHEEAVQTELLTFNLLSAIRG